MAEKEDKVKQVIVMRSDLGMRKGKMVAQGGHAAAAVLSNLMRQMLAPYAEQVQRCLENHTSFTLRFENGHQVVLAWDLLVWIMGPFAKVCVRADSEEQLLEILSQAQSAGLTATLITDSGLTEFNGVPTNTCVGIGPHRSSKIDPITGELKLL